VRSSKDLILEIQSPERLVDLTSRQNLEGHFCSRPRSEGRRLRAFREPTLDSSRMSVRFSFQGPRHPFRLRVPSALGSRIILAAPGSSTFLLFRFALFSSTAPERGSGELRERPRSGSSRKRNTMWSADDVPARAQRPCLATPRGPLVIRAISHPLAEHAFALPVLLAPARWNVFFLAAAVSSSPRDDFIFSTSERDVGSSTTPCVGRGRLRGGERRECLHM